MGIITRSRNINVSDQTLSISIFEKSPILQLFDDSGYKSNNTVDPNQLFLFDLMGQ